MSTALEVSTPSVPARQIRAVYDERTIRVYQAYPHRIADSALAGATFVSPPFSMARMTWIKPSFLWMMYRSGWGLKDEGQARILAIDLSHDGFAWALNHASPTHPDETTGYDEWRRLMERMPVRVQWDPERDLLLRPQAHRAIQIGLSGEAVVLYVQSWIRKITDATPLAHAVHALVEKAQFDEARALLPPERPYTPQTAG